MARKYLMDTNAVIDYLGNKLPSNAAAMLYEEELGISVNTRMELLAWRNATAQQISILKEFIDSTIIHNLEESVILGGIELRKNYRIKLPDAIIAATALVYDLTLVTRNIDDFKNLEGIDLINPWKL